MTEYLRAYYERAEDNQGDSGPLPFVVSTEGMKGDGFSLKAEDWDLSRFKRNNLVLWAHDFFGERPPIGKADARIDGRVLRADITFDPDDSFAQTIERKYRNGFLNAMSVSWDIVDKKNQLLEISAVPIPMDPDALMERAKRGYAEIGATLAKLIDDDTQHETDDAEATRTGAAYQMVRLFLDTASDAESVRVQRYRRVARCYERLAMEPPEFMGSQEVTALDADTFRGLFLAGEPDLVPELFRRESPGPLPDPAEQAEREALARIQQLFAGASQ